MSAGSAATGGSDNQVSGAEAVATRGKTYSSRKITTVNKKIADTNKKNREDRKSPKFVPPSMAILKGLTEGASKMAKESNLKRRKKFLDKKGITLEGDMSDEYISSKKGLAELKASGYTTATDMVNNEGSDNRASDNNSILTKSNQPNDSEPVTAPSEKKTTETTETTETKKKYDVRKTKKKGKRENVLTSSLGVTKLSPDYSLSNATLLGRLV